MDIRQLLFFSAIIDLIGLITTLSMKKPKIQKGIEEFKLENTGNIFKRYFKIGWLPLVLFSVFITGLSLSATSGFKNPFQESLGFSLPMLGVFWALSRLGVSGILLLSSWFKKNLTLFKALVIQGISLSLIYFGISYFHNKWIIATLFICIPVVMWGLSSVKSHFFLDYIKSQNNKASYLSINNFIEKIITAIFALLMGYLVFNFSYQKAYLVFAMFISIVALLLHSSTFIKEKNNLT